MPMPGCGDAGIAALRPWAGVVAAAMAARRRWQGDPAGRRIAGVA